MSGVPGEERRASIAVDLGAESCRVSLLRWDEETPRVQLVARFANGAVEMEQGLRWPFRRIVEQVEETLRRCAELAPEGVRSIGVDGWAVDYVRLDAEGEWMEEPFCYRDPRTLAAEVALHERIGPQRLRVITGIERLRINTLYQLYADGLAGSPLGAGWLNLPEALLARWGAPRVAERTNAAHTQMLDLTIGDWSQEILAAAGLEVGGFPRVVAPGTRLGRMRGPLAELPAFAATELIAPACHDTASAVAGIAAEGEDWAYLSAGTWSLIGTVLAAPCNTPAAQAENFTNLAAAGGRICFHRNVNGLWLLKQCLDWWAAAGQSWAIDDLIAAAELVTAPGREELLYVDEADLLLPGEMPGRINAQRRRRGLAPLETAAAFASLIFHSLAARYAEVLARVEPLTGKRVRRLFVVGGGSRNEFLLRLIAEATGLTVHRGSVESATVGNFAIQLAALEGEATAEAVAGWACRLSSEA